MPVPGRDEEGTRAENKVSARFRLSRLSSTAKPSCDRAEQLPRLSELGHNSPSAVRLSNARSRAQSSPNHRDDPLSGVNSRWRGPGCDGKR